MASILRVDTLTDASSNNSIATSYIASGSAKQWIKFSSVDHSTAASFNTTSITDNGTADSTVTIASDMASANYSIGALGTDYHVTEKDYQGTDPTATLYRLFNFHVSGTSAERTANEEDRVYGHIFGDLA
jgi:hypothetical protein